MSTDKRREVEALVDFNVDRREGLRHKIRGKLLIVFSYANYTPFLSAAVTFFGF